MPSTPVPLGTATAKRSSTGGLAQASNPLRAFVHFNRQRQSRPDDGPEVVVVAVEPLVAGQLEARREQRALHLGRVRHEKIQVPVGASRNPGSSRPPPGP